MCIFQDTIYPKYLVSDIFCSGVSFFLFHLLCFRNAECYFNEWNACNTNILWQFLSSLGVGVILMCFSGVTEMEQRWDVDLPALQVEMVMLFLSVKKRSSDDTQLLLLGHFIDKFPNISIAFEKNIQFSARITVDFTQSRRSSNHKAFFFTPGKVPMNLLQIWATIFWEALLGAIWNESDTFCWARSINLQACDIIKPMKFDQFSSFSASFHLFFFPRKKNQWSNCPFHDFRHTSFCFKNSSQFNITRFERYMQTKLLTNN